jgi:hypothetical protein
LVTTARIGESLRKDDDGGIEAAGGQHRGDHRGGGGLAVHAGDGDSILEAHQLGQHLGALNHGNLAGAGLDNLRIRHADSGAGDNDRGSGNVGGVVALVNGRAHLGQPVGHRPAAQIGA